MLLKIGAVAGEGIVQTDVGSHSTYDRIYGAESRDDFP